MREINPRAWSIDGECWCSRVDYDGYKKEWSGIAPVLAPDNRSKRIGEIEDTNIIVELPTGLKDKNGKEIYEGDIVELCAMKMRGQILYDDVEYFAYLIVGFIDDESLKIHLGNFEWHKLEIIGNIHENPELLETENVD